MDLARVCVCVCVDLPSLPKTSWNAPLAMEVSRLMAEITNLSRLRIRPFVCDCQHAKDTKEEIGFFTVVPALEMTV